MVQKIARLSEEVINKIAAGEVVENPASIVKELIENSIDAGASRIEIAIEKGGVQLLQIEDDGCGMGPEDALLSLERHATSKIRSELDLLGLQTMGFRGEALAAIAAVSLFEMRTSEGTMGTRIVADGGAVRTVEPCARNQGTTLIVRDLFYNVPARKKFLKSPSANGAALLRVVEIAAMAHPEVFFSLRADGKTLLTLHPEKLRKKRIEALLAPLPYELNAKGIWGLLSAPEEAKMHRKEQYLFINKRALFSPLISKAVKAGYGTMIADGNYPPFVLFLEIAPDLIDVNVHPQKKEVRFAEEGKIFALVESAVASAILAPPPEFSRPLSFSPVSFSFNETIIPTKPLKETQSNFDLSIPIRPLAIVEGYFFLQEEGLLLIDLRRAHARVLYEDLKDKKGGLQNLMWPIEALIDSEEMVGDLQDMGIDCRLIGKNKIAIDTLPSFLDPADFSLFLETWKGAKKLDFAASQVAMEAKRKFTLEQAVTLWQHLLKCRETRYDPIGRKIWEKIGGAQLKKMLEGS